MAHTVKLAYPFHGTWRVQNSPANRIPSHGIAAFASSYAIDFVPVSESGRSGPITLRTLLWPEGPERFPGFGRPILAPVDGVVIKRQSAEPDHRTYRGLPSVGYAFTQRRRVRQGWTYLAGNHVMIQTDDQAVVVLCHLQQHSNNVNVGQRVSAGDTIARCGNSGNSTEPHIHLQAIDTGDIRSARPIPVAFPDGLPRNGQVVRA